MESGRSPSKSSKKSKKSKKSAKKVHYPTYKELAVGVKNQIDELLEDMDYIDREVKPQKKQFTVDMDEIIKKEVTPLIFSALITDYISPDRFSEILDDLGNFNVYFSYESDLFNKKYNKALDHFEKLAGYNVDISTFTKKIEILKDIIRNFRKNFITDDEY